MGHMNFLACLLIDLISIIRVAESQQRVTTSVDGDTELMTISIEGTHIGVEIELSCNEVRINGHLVIRTVDSNGILPGALEYAKIYWRPSRWQ